MSTALSHLGFVGTGMLSGSMVQRSSTWEEIFGEARAERKWCGVCKQELKKVEGEWTHQKKCE